MADWMSWLVAAGVLVILELFSGTFYLLMIAVGLAFGAGTAWLGFGSSAQMLVAAIVGVCATVLLRLSRFGKTGKTDATRDPNVNIDIGQTIAVHKWHDGSARVMYRGAQWDVDLAPGSVADAGSFKIVEMRGNRLVVANA